MRPGENKGRIGSSCDESLGSSCVDLVLADLVDLADLADLGVFDYHAYEQEMAGFQLLHDLARQRAFEKGGCISCDSPKILPACLDAVSDEELVHAYLDRGIANSPAQAQRLARMIRHRDG
jgi:hypothetical protein